MRRKQEAAHLGQQVFGACWRQMLAPYDEVLQFWKTLLETHLSGSCCLSSVFPSATRGLTNEPVRELPVVITLKHPLF